MCGLRGAGAGLAVAGLSGAVQGAVVVGVGGCKGAVRRQDPSTNLLMETVLSS